MNILIDKINNYSLQSEAEELQMVKMSKGGAVGSHNKDERLREAANIQIGVGNVQRYCELMVQVGEVSL